MNKEKCSKQNKNKNLKSGFTLLELLVVVLIIGILAAIALPQYKDVVAKAKFTQLLTATKALFEAQQRYILIHGTRSSDLSALDIDIQGGTFTNNLAINDNISFDWGYCRLTRTQSTNVLNEKGIFCRLYKPHVAYFHFFDGTGNICCAGAASGDLGKKICKAEFPNSAGEERDDFCEAGGTRYY